MKTELDNILPENWDERRAEEEARESRNGNGTHEIEEDDEAMSNGSSKFFIPLGVK